MSRVRLLDPENSDGEIARTFRMLARVQRRFVNSTRATAHSPFLARIFIMLVQTLMREGVKKFAEPQKALITLIAGKRAALKPIAADR